MSEAIFRSAQRRAMSDKAPLTLVKSRRFNAAPRVVPRSTVAGMPRRKPRSPRLPPTAKPQSSDQAPGEEVTQVNDQYKGGGPAPQAGPREHAQHQTGG
jgi:hypothetical protein